MNDDDMDMMVHLLAVAKERYDGHLTIMRFTTNWRIDFYQPQDRDQIEAMPCGATLAEAGAAALQAAGLREYPLEAD
jgi:hypothetical protein